jgi:acyl-CoA dehydrogenase
MTSHSPEFNAHLATLKAIASDVAATNAADVDAKARFPRETIDALKKAKLLSAPIPRELGGAGYGMRELAALCSTLAQACGSSAMVLAMHYIQVACIVRHAKSSTYFSDYLREIVEILILVDYMSYVK